MPSFSLSGEETFRTRSQGPHRPTSPGPDHGTVELPLHLAWSGLRSFDLDQPRLRMSLYRIVLAEGMREDLVRHLDRDVLVTSWPVLRTLISRAVRDVREDAFAELAAVGRTAA